MKFISWSQFLKRFCSFRGQKQNITVKTLRLEALVLPHYIQNY